MRVSVFRRTRFNAAHRIYNKNWSDEKNMEVFGLCSLPNFHGHNYLVEAKLTGEQDPDTGYVYDLGKLNKIIESEISERFDHKNLNLDCKEFENKIPTAENIVIVIYELLRKKIDQEFDLQVRLYETERNFVEYPPA